jgi:hypothetical protein
VRLRSTAVLVALVTAAHLCVIAAPAFAVTADAGASPSAPGSAVTGRPTLPSTSLPRLLRRPPSRRP